jgi:hypothetical protein
VSKRIEMSTNLEKKFKGFKLKVFIIFINLNTPFFAISQNCSQTLDFQFSVSKIGQGVNWSQFPAFSLPFKIVYGGTSQFANADLILKRGYTHIANPNSLTNIPKEKRAFIYYNVADSNPKQPWDLYKSPFGNDMSVLEDSWTKERNRIIAETGGINKIESDILIFDIEKQIKSEDSILLLKKASYTPQEFKLLSDQQFIEKYKKDLQALYGKAANYVLNKQSIPFISSYSDAPILNTFINIQGKSWEAWKTDKSALNYISYDFDNQKVGGPMYNIQNLITPSAYFYFDYPHPFAGEYLSYLLFQIEVNQAWTNKELMLFVWRKYSFNQAVLGKNIKPWMAEAMAIFPLVAGAKGIWFWEDPFAETEDLANYEYFTKGLYRLSKFKSIFEGDYKIIQDLSAREYNQNKKPIWRGVLNGNNLLVAAHNPYAKSENEEVRVLIGYNGWLKEITLKGYEIFLCQFDISVPTGLENEIGFNTLNVFPNPNAGVFKLNITLENPSDFEISLFDLSGKECYHESVKNNALNIEKVIDLNNKVFVNNLIVVIKQGDKSFSKRIILN